MVFYGPVSKYALLLSGYCGLQLAEYASTSPASFSLDDTVTNGLAQNVSKISAKNAQEELIISKLSEIIDNDSA